MLAEAALAVERMKAAAVEARRLQALAELARHMRATAAKLADRPVGEAADSVASEWMKAWSLDAGAYPALTGAVADFAIAFSRDARGSTPPTQAAIRAAFEALEAGFAAAGTTLADEMAFRSECAHGWWRSVKPVPPAFAGAPRFARIPAPEAHEPFWAAGPQPHCR